MVENMKTALICIATGPIYQQYARELHKSAAQYFPQAKFVLFSDHEQNPGVDLHFRIRGKGYPQETLYRYHTMIQQTDALLEFNQIFYCDADMLFVAPVGNEIYGPLVATLHPGFAERNRRGTPEMRRESAAFCDQNDAYYCGGFQGGHVGIYLRAATVMAERISYDYVKGITAIWHDESHWNWFLANIRQDFTKLSPSYCYPENYDGGYGWPPEKYPPILIARDKRGKRV